METAITAHTEGGHNPARGEVSCRSCGTPLTRVFVDLGSSPLANSYPSAADLERAEIFYPLRVYVCDRCFLVQLPSVVTPEELFSDYAYLSSFSDSWVRHAAEYVELVSGRFGLGSTSKVVEIASNDGYLLQHFKRTRNPRPGDRAGEKRRRGRRDEGHSHAGRVLRIGHGATRSPRPARAPTC